MSFTTVTNTYSGGSSTQYPISIPSNTRNVQVVLSGSRGGNGGSDASMAGGPGGSGRRVTLKFIDEFVSRTPTFYVAANGANGASNSNNTVLNCNGRLSGIANGGCGGHPGPNGSSGQGGSGGGAIGIKNNAGIDIVVIGGAGGGGGASHPPPGRQGRQGGDGGSISGTTSISVSNGVNGQSQGNDGGGGGGGGGGAPGGAGGERGTDGVIGGGGGDGGGSLYRSDIFTLLQQSLHTDSTSSIVLSYELLTPQILSFSANPNPQTSGSSGFPQDTTTLQWNCVDGNRLEIYRSGTLIYQTDSLTGNLNVDTNLQSVVGVNSPATITYTLILYAGTVQTSSNLTVQVYNDNTPNDFNLLLTTTSGVNINNLEPNTTYQISSPSVTGIDMITAITTLSAGLEASLTGSSWSSVIYISNSQSFLLRFTSPPFNTDPSGLSNSTTYNYTVGTLSKSLTISTRAPDVGELFDFGDSSVNYPFPDIDTVANTPQQYIISPTTITMGDSGRPPDAEIPVEIKSSNPDIQIRIKPQGSSIYNDWQNIRQI